MKELEKALGLNLFDRKGKSLQPNATGRRVALATQTFFGALDDVMDVAQARAETIRLGAGEAMLRWFVMPHLAELMAGDPPLRFDVYNLTTESAVREILAGGVDLVIMRTDAVPDALQSEVVKTVQYILAVPRTLLRSARVRRCLREDPCPLPACGRWIFHPDSPKPLRRRWG